MNRILKRIANLKNINDIAAQIIKELSRPLTNAECFHILLKYLNTLSFNADHKSLNTEFMNIVNDIKNSSRTENKMYKFLYGLFEEPKPIINIYEMVADYASNHDLFKETKANNEFWDAADDIIILIQRQKAWDYLHEIQNYIQKIEHDSKHNTIIKQLLERKIGINIEKQYIYNSIMKQIKIDTTTVNKLADLLISKGCSSKKQAYKHLSEDKVCKDVIEQAIDSTNIFNIDILKLIQTNVDKYVNSANKTYIQNYIYRKIISQIYDKIANIAKELYESTLENFNDDFVIKNILKKLSGIESSLNYKELITKYLQDNNTNNSYSEICNDISTAINSHNFKQNKMYKIIQSNFTSLIPDIKNLINKYMDIYDIPYTSFNKIYNYICNVKSYDILQEVNDYIHNTDCKQFIDDYIEQMNEHLISSLSSQYVQEVSNNVIKQIRIDTNIIKNIIESLSHRSCDTEQSVYDHLLNNDKEINYKRYINECIEDMPVFHFGINIPILIQNESKKYLKSHKLFNIKTAHEIQSLVQQNICDAIYSKLRNTRAKIIPFKRM